jgi:hypothetical protein
MKKGTLIKMDEARHVLVERDILTATKSPWLVRLLYAFQDPEHVSSSPPHGNPAYLLGRCTLYYPFQSWADDSRADIWQWNTCPEEISERCSITLEY